MSQTLDLVTLEVIRNALPAIANEMAADLQRTSYNMMIYEVRDFCTALVNAKGELISQNMGGVSHFVADLGVIITDAVKRFGHDGFQPGDVIIMNHQAVAGQHLNNVVIYTPYFHNGELLMFAMVRAHWIDIGGASTGFGAGAAVTEPWLEGLQLDQLKIYEAGKPCESLLKVIRDNIRFPEASFGDLRSQMAACRLAMRRLDELLEKFGRDTLLAAIEQIFDESEAKCRNVVASIPNGVYEAEALYDGPTPDRSGTVRLHSRVTIDNGAMTIDFSGCSPERRTSGLNARTLAGGRVAYKALTTPLEPVNEGSFRALKVIVPEGSIMMARYPVAMTTWSFLPTVVDTVVAALAPAIPDRIPAAHHGLLGGAVVFFGIDPDTGKRFLVQSIEGGGWGGRPEEDGASGTVSVCQGDVRNGSIEGIELKNPVLIKERRLRCDSGGAGKFRGGLGIDLRMIGLVEGRWNFTGHFRVECPPWGIKNGKAGATAHYLLKKPGENDFLAMCENRYPVPAGSEVIVRTGGGGGWGEPLERDPSRVQADVSEGFISIEAARHQYGVMVDQQDLSVDREGTRLLRAERQYAEMTAAD
jgi:N-methylhydantoinase B